MRYFIAVFTLILCFAYEMNAQVTTTDSSFINKARPIKFNVNKTDIAEQDRLWITSVLVPELNALGEDGIVLGRSGASPEGPTTNNWRLAQSRRKAMDAILAEYGIATSRIRYDVVAEDYPLLGALMRLANDPLYPEFDSIVNKYRNGGDALKNALLKYKSGSLWQHIFKVYFPKLRAVRIMAIDRKLVDITPLALPIKAVPMLFPYDMTVVAPALSIDVPQYTLPTKISRRELMSVKTNLLLDFAYMPGYDHFCPIPNVAIEYYPLHGHFTYGASFDGPWWQDCDAHKYFQLRNYQLFTRYYVKSGDIAKRRPGEGAAFKGLFFNMYAHAFLYNICFGEKRGWEGEGWGAGLGIGYAVPLGKSEHWRLEFGIQAGVFNTKYDPYQWLCPIDPDSDKQLYYYKWYGEAKNFKKRQHSYWWLGPTRAEITLSYDIFYRKWKN